MTEITDDVLRVVTPATQPDWLDRANQVGALFVQKDVIQLEEDSLLTTASRNTGLDDFGNDGWLAHFRVLIQAIEEEAQLHFFGRALTREDFVRYLEARLQLTHEYKQNPSIDDEVVNPIFIIGMGRTGTTILQELMGYDPQFRAVQRWEGSFPSPPPEESTYETDPRIQRAQRIPDIYHAMTPLFEAQHQMGATIPVEDLEFTAPAFLTEMFTIQFDIPTFARHLAKHGDDLHLGWHKRLLKLLQSRYRRPHWVLKNPTHLGRVDKLLETYPNAKFIFTHRDPVVALDSVHGPGASIAGLRSRVRRAEQDTAKAWASAWDSTIGVIQSGAIKSDAYVNFKFRDFQQDKLGTIERVYQTLGLQLAPDVRSRMEALLGSRPKGSQGNANQYARTDSNSARGKRERELFASYQAFFNVPTEG